MSQPIIHTELYASNHASLAAWYKEMFGWESKDQSDMDYSSGWWTESGWGFNDAKNGVKPGEVVPYIASSDIAGDARKLAANGAVVDEVLQVPGVGRIVHFRDPDGNHMAMIEPFMPDQPQGAG